MAKVAEAKIRTESQKLFSQAKKYIPGGVNSPVRSFKSVGGNPVFISKASGPYLYGEDGKRYIDYCLSWGALILGHADLEVIKKLKEVISKGTSFGAVTKLETELAKLIVEAVPSIEQVRLVNSGTEAVMSAIRLARAYSGKTKIIKFEGSYHGHADYLLAKAGSGLATLGIPNSRGVPSDFTKHTITLDFNNLKAVQKTAEKYSKDLAAIIVEPVAANCGLILPQEGFLQTLRKIADKYNIVLIFDEVITGFRVCYQGAQGFLGVKPDLTCLGKIIGGGLPVGAFGGKKEIMKLLAPLGDVYQAGTLSGNPLAVTAGIATLKKLNNRKIYENLERKAKELCEAIKVISRKNRVNLEINYISSMFSVFFTKGKVIDYKTAQAQDLTIFKKLFQGLLREGIYFSPSGFETNFLSIAHTKEIIEKTLQVFSKLLKK
ncbi:MAG: glutamate-1-semialdehyde 2,1-aminomutase [Omnitrophica bacterium]|nr:glutamate-1-semialdehyde 2,1-aminomutase [Candidatus Omnitrophota bacterium]